METNTTSQFGKVIVMREATNDTKLETSYCKSCGHNHYMNIGTRTCVKCGNSK